MKKRTFYIIGIVLFAFVVLLVYALLGGFREPEYSIAPRAAYSLAGYEYQGRYTEKRLEKIFYSARALNEAIPNSTLALVTFIEPEKARDTLHQFIGVVLPEQGASIADSVDRLSLPASQVARAYLNKHALVMPRPAEVKAWLKDYAEDQGYRLTGEPSVEKYLAESELIVELPVEKVN